MRFPPLPSGTVSFVIASVITLIFWLVWGSFKYPEALWAPGNLSHHHAQQSECSDCHQPFQGATANKCASCHNRQRFNTHSPSTVSEFHQKILTEEKPCSGCHTEHRGALASITLGALDNPHGDFIFRATTTQSCAACHDFSADSESPSHLLDNAIVSHLMHEGEGQHRQGQMAHCLACHTGDQRYIEKESAKSGRSNSATTF